MSAVARTRDHNNRTIPMREDQLTARHRLLIEYMLHGLPHPTLCERVRVTDGYDPETGEPILRHPRVGEPLDLIDAATVLHIKRRNARNLSKQPAFERLLAAETSAFRNGAKARATRRMVALIDEPGQGKAADRKVQLAAAQAVLGESDARSPGVTVNVTAQQAGIIIRMPGSRDQARTIEHEDA